MSQEISMDDETYNSIPAETRERIVKELTQLDLLPEGTTVKPSGAASGSETSSTYDGAGNFIQELRGFSAQCDAVGYAAYRACVAAGGEDFYCQILGGFAKEACERG